MSRIIKNEQELQEYFAEVRNRQYEVDPIKVDLTESINKENQLRFSPTSTHDWDNEYLEIIRVGRTEVVKTRYYK